MEDQNKYNTNTPFMIQSSSGQNKEKMSCETRIFKYYIHDGYRVLVQKSNGYIELLDFNTYGLTEHLIVWMPLPKPYRGGE